MLESKLNQKMGLGRGLRWFMAKLWQWSSHGHNLRAPACYGDIVASGAPAPLENDMSHEDKREPLPKFDFSNGKHDASNQHDPVFLAWRWWECNCALWVSYGFVKVPHELFVAIANIPGLVLWLVAAITSAPESIVRED